LGCAKPHKTESPDFAVKVSSPAARRVTISLAAAAGGAAAAGAGGFDGAGFAAAADLQDRHDAATTADVNDRVRADAADASGVLATDGKGAQRQVLLFLQDFGAFHHRHDVLAHRHVLLDHSLLVDGLIQPLQPFVGSAEGAHDDILPAESA